MASQGLVTTRQPIAISPGGALPAGFTLVVGTPLALPLGVLPPPFIWTGVIAVEHQEVVQGGSRRWMMGSEAVLGVTLHM
jgi:hypothetical protein